VVSFTTCSVNILVRGISTSTISYSCELPPVIDRMASLVEKSRKSSGLVHWFPPFLACAWDAAQPLLQRYTLKPGQDSFDLFFSLWLPSATRIALSMIRRYVSESTASRHSTLEWTEQLKNIARFIHRSRPVVFSRTFYKPPKAIIADVLQHPSNFIYNMEGFLVKLCIKNKN
jgi:hypothetical protein